ncbi:hypothetical protein ACIOMM_31885 [Streptomyces sp. NPDC087908]|uniref:hypothetical protein n=1 Tax=Streptomyces sp. NPDC087908 TaxID=3365820 RepID=UPI00382D7801
MGGDDALQAVELVLFAGVPEGGGQRVVNERSEPLDLDEDVFDVAIGPRDVDAVLRGGGDAAAGMPYALALGGGGVGAGRGG